jgi:hypothetical protein
VSGPLEAQAEIVPDKPRGGPPRLRLQRAAGVRPAMPQAPGALAGSKEGRRAGAALNELLFPAGAPFQKARD